MRLQEIILKTIELGKSFKGFSAVTDVNLDVIRGAIHALIGPNGAGKTTCFNLLTKFLEPLAADKSCSTVLTLLKRLRHRLPEGASSGLFRFRLYFHI
ncbi:ATP-binding cassette domain-containing protein [Polynucleobacter necessarius]|uniref:ATP-binding cassette domain-containing protein n=1 Tax=Polynucleobacter necessarius TaxID=576610 RepID=UPI0039E35AE4